MQESDGRKGDLDATCEDTVKLDNISASEDVVVMGIQLALIRQLQASVDEDMGNFSVPLFSAQSWLAQHKLTPAQVKDAFNTQDLTFGRSFLSHIKIALINLEEEYPTVFAALNSRLPISRGATQEDVRIGRGVPIPGGRGRAGSGANITFMPPRRDTGVNETEITAAVGSVAFPKMFTPDGKFGGKG